MKIDGEPAYYQSNLAHKPNSKCVECDDSIVNDTGAQEAGEKLTKENENGVSCDLKDNERDVDSVPSQRSRDGLWNVSEFDCSTSDDSTNANEDEVRDFEEPYSHSSEQIGLYQKDMEFYNPKSVMDCELPELIVCYKESHDNVIKDICVDEGVTSLGKILFGHRVDEHNGLCTFLPPDEDKIDGLMKGNTDSTVSVPDDLKSSAEEDRCKDSTHQCASTVPVQIDLAKSDVIDTTENKFVPESMDSVEHIGKEDFQPEFCGNNGNEVNQQSVQISIKEAMSESPALDLAAEEPNNNSNKPIIIPVPASAVEELNSNSNKAIMIPAPASAVEDSNDNGLANDICYDSKVESGSITFNFDSSAPASSGREEGSQNGDLEHLETQNVPKLEEGISDFQTVSNQVRHSPGESSFSVTGPISGLITYSGPIAYSGSCSLRSDSSTTSTRSFAFPVLQTEWNSSPVRMAKADRRHFRKHRGWRHGLLCCRF